MDAKDTHVRAEELPVHMSFLKLDMIHFSTR